MKKYKNLFKYTNICINKDITLEHTFINIKTLKVRNSQSSKKTMFINVNILITLFNIKFLT